MGNRHPSITPFEPYAAADRLIVIAAGNDALFGKLCQALGQPELANDSRFIDNRQRTRHAEELKIALEEVLRNAPAAHWVEVLESAGVPCCLIQNVAEAAAHLQTRARNMIVQAGDGATATEEIKDSSAALADPGSPQ